MNIYIEVGKFNKRNEEKKLVDFVTAGDIEESAYLPQFKNKKERLKVAQALLDLAYLIEQDVEQSDFIYAGQ